MGFIQDAKAPRILYTSMVREYDTRVCGKNTAVVPRQVENLGLIIAHSVHDLFCIAEDTAGMKMSDYELIYFSQFISAKEEKVREMMGIYEPEKIAFAYSMFVDEIKSKEGKNSHPVRGAGVTTSRQESIHALITARNSLLFARAQIDNVAHRLVFEFSGQEKPALDAYHINFSQELAALRSRMIHELGPAMQALEQKLKEKDVTQ